MTAKSLIIAIAGLFCAAPHFASAQQQASPVEQRLREQLKAALLQIRTAESERATLLAAQAELDQKVKTLTEQVAALTKQGAEDKEASDKVVAKLNDELAAKSADITRINELLVKSDTAGKKAAELAKTKEEQRAKLAAQAIELQRTVADQRMKNAKMYEAGIEVLSRYEKFGLGTALTAREPFVGITRVKFENLIQDYGDKLADQRIKAPESKPKAKP
jgi:trehalose/maltose hydrolase-like predicted phosphorylase